VNVLVLKKGALGIFFACAVILSGSGMLSAAEPQGPRLVVTQERYDFGAVAQGTRVEHVFAIRNGGDEPLDIQEVRAS